MLAGGAAMAALIVLLELGGRMAEWWF